MKHLIYFIATMVLSVVLITPTPSNSQAFRIVATVNETPISNVDLEGRINLFVLSANLDPTAENKKSVAPQALNSLIDDALRLQEAEDIGVEIKEAELKAGLKQIARQNNLSVENFERVFSQHFGAWQSLQNQIKAQIAWQGVVSSRLRPQITISEDDIDQQIRDIKSDVGKTEFNIAEIRLNKDPNETTVQLNELAQTIYKELGKGASFNSLAQQFSEGIEASRGGMVGWVKATTMDPDVADVLKTMTKGDVSKPINTDSGIVILRLNNKRTIQAPKAILANNDGQNVDEYRLFQIFVPIPDESRTQRKEKLALSISDKAENCDDMKMLSDIYNTPQSGDLGFVKASDMPSDIRSVAMTLDINQTSKPIAKDDGFSVIMICDQRSTTVTQSAEDAETEQTVRDMIANQLGGERLNKLQSQYFQDLKNAAFIEFAQG